MDIIRVYFNGSDGKAKELSFATSSWYHKPKIFLRAPINCPDTFEFQACVLMFKNMFPNCVVHFSA